MECPECGHEFSEAPISESLSALQRISKSDYREFLHPKYAMRVLAFIKELETEGDSDG